MTGCQREIVPAANAVSSAAEVIVKRRRLVKCNNGVGMAESILSALASLAQRLSQWRSA